MLVVADTGVLISLIHIHHLELIEQIFGDYVIAQAVWDELNSYDNPQFDQSKLTALVPKVRKISSRNYLTTLMDIGEAESSILYDEVNADYLLIDDNKARKIAESLDIQCIGTLGLLLKAKEVGLITELKPIFTEFLTHGRYFSVSLLNQILLKVGEDVLG